MALLLLLEDVYVHIHEPFIIFFSIKARKRPGNPTRLGMAGDDRTACALLDMSLDSKNGYKSDNSTLPP